MATSSDGRRDAAYAVISAQKNFALLSEAEKATVKANLGSIFGADLAYLVSHTEVQPGSMYDPAGASVTTAGGPAAQSGTVTSSSNIMGTGKIS